MLAEKAEDDFRTHKEKGNKLLRKDREDQVTVTPPSQAIQSNNRKAPKHAGRYKGTASSSKGQ